MSNKLLLTAFALLAGCASAPPPAPDETPAPVVISEGQPAAPEPPPPADTPPPPDPGKPQQTDSGRFRIAIASLDSAELTAKWVSKAEAAGYRTEVLAVEIDGKTWHRVLLPGYATLDEAKAALSYVQQDLDAAGAWVTSRRRAPAPPGETGAPPPAEAPPPPPPEQPAN